MPLKKLKSVFKSITKPFKKVLRSPIGKAALGIGAFMYGPKFLGGKQMGMGLPGWQALEWGKIPAWKIATGVMGTGAALGEEEENTVSAITDTSGHEGYLNARKNFVDEWASWYMQQGDDEATAYAKAREAMFNDGGIVGLAQGGRIGFKDGHPHPGIASQYSTPAKTDKHVHPGIASQYSDVPVRIPSGELITHKTVLPPNKPIKTKDNTVRTPFYGPLITALNWTGDQFKNSAFGKWNNELQRKNYLKKLQETDADEYAKVMSDLEKINAVTRGVDLSTHTKFEDDDPMTMGTDTISYNDLWDDQVKEVLGEGYTNYLNRFNKPPEGGDGPQEEWQRLGYPSYEAYMAAMQGGGGGGAPTDTTADYYGFSEWADWDPNNTAPLFGDATQYKAVLSKGGRIGLYAGGMGGMNNTMNPMMTQGLGAMGSPGMNPFNQQNLMAQAQMRGNPMMGRGNPMMMGRGNPMMMSQRPGIPGQGQGISGTQAAAKMAKKEDDGELLKLIRMLASMGIPMEQLRGRTKEELVEMAISIQSKDQAVGRPEVVEESEVEEEVVEAAHGGRIGLSDGSKWITKKPKKLSDFEIRLKVIDIMNAGERPSREMFESDEDYNRGVKDFEFIEYIKTPEGKKDMAGKRLRNFQAEVEAAKEGGIRSDRVFDREAKGYRHPEDLVVKKMLNENYTADRLQQLKDAYEWSPSAGPERTWDDGSRDQFFEHQYKYLPEPDFSDFDFSANEEQIESPMNLQRRPEFEEVEDDSLIIRAAHGGRIGLYSGGNGNELPEDPTKPINPFAPKPTGPVLPDKMASKEGFTLEDALTEEDRKVKESFEAYKRYKQSGGEKSFEEFMKMIGVGGLAHGGRVHAAGGYGYPNPDQEYIDVSGEAGVEYLRENHPGMLAEMYSDEEQEVVIPKAGGGLMRTRYAMGSEQPVIPSKDGPQIDYREMGGYQPHGKKEKHDDVRALLAQGEFVVTSDAVKGIGGGDRDLGAKRMYDMMHKYEPIGRALS
jgi:hypothetical protein